MLRVDISGSGPDLVVLHGWAMHCGVFDGISDELAKHFRVHCIDLPGHGHNAGTPLGDELDDVAAKVLDAAPDAAHWMGWSLGGMVSLAAASLAPHRVHRLVTVASAPKFIASADWPHAVAEADLDRMAADLKNDFRATVDRFLALQVLGDDRAVAMLRDLRDMAYAHGEPAARSLVNGLRILHDADLRPRLARIASPLLAIMGSRDRLTPPAAGEALAKLVPDGRSITIPKAAHMPFISHREEFLAAVETFLRHDTHE